MIVAESVLRVKSRSLVLSKLPALLRGSAWIEVRFSTDANHAGLKLFGIPRLAIRLGIPQPILASTR